MKKNIKLGISYIVLSAILTGCGQSAATTQNEVKDTVVSQSDETNIQNDALSEQTKNTNEASAKQETKNQSSKNTKTAPGLDVNMESATEIILSDDGITVQGEAVSSDTTQAVYIANDIVYYEAGKDFTYGEGTAADEHTKEEADLHTVVHITDPGTYTVSGKLSNGQIAIDLGEDAKKDPDSVVNLVLNGADISCSVAPAVIFYNVYECGSKDEDNATSTVDTTNAGANVVIADGTINNIEGSYVARIYESYELSEDGTEVVDSEKLHKYDAAFYSKRSMNIYGGEEGTGVLNIVAENEGLDSELHLTINGGNVNIISGNDGINTNEDGISVTTINGGNLKIIVDGSTGEGDGIDSNGWLVINGGNVAAEACKSSADAGIDSDMGIHINGGSVAATGNMLDHISDSEQNYVVMNFSQKQSGQNTYCIKNDKGDIVAECNPVNDFTYLIFSDDALTEGTYTAWMGETQLAAAAGDAMPAFGMGGGMKKPDGEKFDREKPGDMERPEMPDGEMPNGEMPADMERPKGNRGERGNNAAFAEVSTELVMTSQGNYFNNVGIAE